MYFASDNSGPVHPQVMDAVMRANEGYAWAYGNDPIMDEVRAQIRDIFEAPEAAVYLVATGTAANVLSLATLAQPWQAIFCTPVAHIEGDECNAPEFYSGGAKLVLVGDSDKMPVHALDAAITQQAPLGVHSPQPGPVSITQVTERGGVYDLNHLKGLCDVAKRHGVPVHLDGARFANAVVTANHSAADVTWRAGVDAVSFGATKNGTMGVEAVIFFDPKHAWEFELRRKRGAHLFSKHRYLSAQMQGYLADDLWLTTARQANAAAAELAAGLIEKGAVMAHPVEANMIFVSFPRGVHQRLFEAGAMYNMMDGDVANGDPNEVLQARLVCDWSTSSENIARFLSFF